MVADHSRRCSSLQVERVYRLAGSTLRPRGLENLTEVVPLGSGRGRGVVEAVAGVDDAPSRIARYVSEGEPEGLFEDVARHTSQENGLAQIHSTRASQKVESRAQHCLATASRCWTSLLPCSSEQRLQL